LITFRLGATVSSVTASTDAYFQDLIVTIDDLLL